MPENWSPELRLCAQLCRREPVGVTTEGKIDWVRVRDLSSKHRVAALIGAALKQNPGLDVPDDVRGWFQQAERLQEFRSLRVSAALLRTVQDLEDSGVPALVLKGSAVAQRYYEHPAHREAVDVDLLIPDSKVIVARTALGQAGYVLRSSDAPDATAPYGDAYLRLTGAVEYLHPVLDVPIDLHWNATWPHDFGWTYSGLENDFDGFDLEGRAFRVLSHSVQFHYLIYHGAKHGWAYLRWLADIDRVAPFLTARDMEEFWQRARAQRSEPIVIASLEHYGAVFDRDLGSFGIEKRRSQAGAISRLRRHFEDAVDAKPFAEMRLSEKLLSRLAEYRYHLAWSGGLRAFGFLIAQFLADRRHVRRLRLSGRWLWLYVAIGPPFRTWIFFERRWAELRSRKG